MVHGDAREGKWRESWRMEWVGSTIHTISEHAVSSITARLKRDGTRAETRFGLSEKRTSPFKSAGESVQSTACSRGVRISGQTIDHVPRHSARVVATLSNRLFPHHLPSNASPCTITFRTASNTQSSAPEDGRDYRPKNVELTGIINKPLLLHLVGWLHYLYQWCTVIQTSDFFDSSLGVLIGVRNNKILTEC